jgi:hypothetical protein
MTYVVSQISDANFANPNESVTWLLQVMLLFFATHLKEGLQITPQVRVLFYEEISKEPTKYIKHQPKNNHPPTYDSFVVICNKVLKIYQFHDRFLYCYSNVFLLLYYSYFMQQAYAHKMDWKTALCNYFNYP